MTRICDILLIISLGLLLTGNSYAAEFCQLNKPTNKIELPNFPNEFETRILMTNARNLTSDVLLLYDSYERKAELIVEERGISYKRLYYFDANEIIQTGQIRNSATTCFVSSMIKADDLFFSLVNSINSIAYINTPNDVFHFNADKFPIVSL